MALRANPLVAVLGLPALAVVGAVGLLSALLVGLGAWTREEAPKVPPHLEAIYRQVEFDIGVPWAALAAWDGAEYGFDLPVPSPEDFFRELYEEELAKRVRDWEEWCEAHRDPETGLLPSPECDSPPSDLPPAEVDGLLFRAFWLYLEAVREHITSHAEELLPRVPTLDRNPEDAFRGLLAPDLVPLANDLFEGYMVLTYLDEELPDNGDVAATGPPLAFDPATGFWWPVEGSITSRFGPRWGRLHAGIDIAVPTGTPVRASQAGRVASAGLGTELGWFVRLDHGDGYTTVYAHNSRLAVGRGEMVRQGDVVAYSGSTGRSTGPHLHFEIRVRDVPYDPLLFLGR